MEETFFFLERQKYISTRRDHVPRLKSYVGIMPSRELGVIVRVHFEHEQQKECLRQPTIFSASPVLGSLSKIPPPLPAKFAQQPDTFFWALTAEKPHGNCFHLLTQCVSQYPSDIIEGSALRFWRADQDL